MIREKFDLSGKRGIVTGASRGLGRAMALGLADMGASVAASARTTDRLETLKDEAAPMAGRIYPVPADMTRDDDIERLVGETVREFGGIDFAVFNAGIIRRGASHDHSITDFDDVLRVNVHAVFLGAKTVAKKMIAQGTGGSLILTGSVVAVHGSRNVPGYAASKGAIHSMTRTMANDWGNSGIRVNVIAPGFCETDMTGGIRSDAGRFEELTARMALGRWGRPEDFAGAAVFLASDASAYVTGTTLVVDGGFLGM